MGAWGRVLAEVQGQTQMLGGNKKRLQFPLAAVVGQEEIKSALLLGAVRATTIPKHPRRRNRQALLTSDAYFFSARHGVSRN